MASLLIAFATVLFSLALYTEAWNVRAGLRHLAAGVALAGSCLSLAQPCLANREVGSIPGSGIIFKDTLRIQAFEDPKVDGVVLYLSDFDRPITEKLGMSFFNDPSTSSITCARTGPIVLRKDVNLTPEGEEVFEESRNLFFKQIRVRRVIDKDTKTVIYASYSTRFDKGGDENKARFKSSLCAVHID